MFDRRRLMGLGLSAGLSLTTPALALAASRKHGARHHGGRGSHHPAHRPHAASLASRELNPEPLKLVNAGEDPRVITLKNLHTDEALEAVYWDGGRYVPDALDAVNKVLRDYRTGEIHPIAPDLLDLLTDVRTATGSTRPFQVISGYRSAQTNAMLRERSAEVAQHSFHMDGMAIDVYLDDVDLDRLRTATLSLGRGGVGYYPVSRFVHMDVGPVRRWEGA